MIIGLGSDLIDIRRVDKSIERFGERFLGRIFTQLERDKSDKRAQRAASYAKRFAAKEACSKALGTGLRRGVFWRDMGVINLPGGKPSMKLTNGALKRLQEITPAGYTALAAGFALLPSTIVMFLLSKRMGRLADRFGPTRSICFCLVGIILDLALLNLMSSTFAGTAIVLFALTCFSWATFPAYQSFLLALEPDHGIVVLSLNNATSYLGLGAAAVLGSLVIGAGHTSALPYVGCVVGLLALATWLIINSARLRKESRGLHYNVDHPKTLSKARHTVLRPPRLALNSRKV